MTIALNTDNAEKLLQESIRNKIARFCILKFPKRVNISEFLSYIVGLKGKK